MKIAIKDKNLASSLTLFIIASLFLFIGLVTNRGDLTTATVIMSALILYLSAIFFYSLNKPELIDGTIASLLNPQNTINLCRIATDLGMNGHAVLIRKKVGEISQISQFIPVSEYKGGELTGDSFVQGPGGVGLLVSPQGLPIMNYLKSKANLQIPHKEKDIFRLIQNIGADILEIAEKVQVKKTDTGYFITIYHYELISGCQILHQESPACCLMNPCPICSLFGMILAEGTGKSLILIRCFPDKEKNGVKIIYDVI